MKIKDLHIDGFGVWNDLKLAELNERITVFYGPNEAGKTTLLQFIRAMLYGFSPPRRQRYLPPLRGGRPGGALTVLSPQGVYTLDRHDDSPAAIPLGLARLLAENGQAQHEQLLKAVLGGVDEPIYNNVFAVGLREIQELGLLEDTAAAELLYKLSTGMDRVSLVDVTRDITSSRTSLLSTDDRPSQITTLLQRREQLQAEIDTLHESTAQYTRLLAQREQLDDDVARAEAQQQQLDRQSRLLDIAIAVRDKWQNRTDVENQLTSLAQVKRLPHGLAEAVERLNAKLAEHRRHADEHRAQRRKIKDELAKLTINEVFWRRVPHVQTLLDQQQWLTKIEEEQRTLEADGHTIERELAASRHKVAEHPTVKIGGTTVSAEGWAVVLPAARNLSKALRRARHAEEAVRRIENHAETVGDDVQLALARVQESSLPRAIEKAGQNVGLLRRRVQLEERIEQLKRHHLELLDDSHGLLDRQLLPPGWLAVLGGVFAAGISMAFMGVFFPSASSTGWYLVMGMIGVFGSLLIKRGLEHTAASQFADAQREIGLVESQLNEAKAERDQLETQLPHSVGSPATRLKTAEAELAQLEQLLGVESQRKVARQEVENAKQEARTANEASEAARRRWKQALQNAGLPATITMTQLKDLRNVKPRDNSTDELTRKLERRRHELAERDRELKSFTDRVVQLFNDVQIEPRSGKLVDQLKQLQEEIKTQEGKLVRQEQLRKRAKYLRRLALREFQAYKKVQARRRKALRRAQCKDEVELRQRVATIERIDQLQGQREQLSREIGQALGQFGTEDVIREYFDHYKPSQLERLLTELAGKRATASQALQQAVEQRGRLTEQMNQLTQDRRVAQKMLDLSVVDEQLKQAAAQWQTLAVAGTMLETIRKTFEAHRQPETLREASEFLVKLTEGHYKRVWTPMDRDTLLVDDNEGNTLGVEVLSRGTREQVFLSLRLALIGAYARRGAVLPIVLDDVLVNFDAHRAAAAAKVLCEFAKQGHQLLIFTCHEHIALMFHKLDAKVFRLPNNHQRGPKEAIAIRVDKPVVAPPPPPPTRSLQPPVVKAPSPVEPKPAPKQVVVEAAPPPVEIHVNVPPPEPKGPKLMRRRKAAESPAPAKPIELAARGPTRVRKANDFFAGSQWHDPIDDDGNDHGEHGLKYDENFTEEDALWYGVEGQRSEQPALSVHQSSADVASE